MMVSLFASKDAHYSCPSLFDYGGRGGELRLPRIRSTVFPFAARTSSAVDAGRPARCATLETTLGQIDGFFTQLPFKCYLPEIASVRD